MPKRQRSLLFIYGVSLAIILLIAALPLVAALGSGALAEALGCHFDESRIRPCIIAGTDYGRAFYIAGMMGWFALVTIPYGAAAVGLWLLALIIHLAIRLTR
jgi:hypothetical protein